MARLYCLAALALGLSAPAAAQDAPPQDGESLNEIVVTAQRSGAPMWTAETNRGTVILVGEIREVPKSTPWYPDRLELATRRAQRVTLGIKPKISPGDIFRLLFAGGKLTKLPKGTVASDYLDEDRRARLAALEKRYDQDYSRKSLLITSFDLLSRRVGLTRDTGQDATDVVKKAARRADVPSEPVGTVRGEDLLDSLSEASPESHLPCLDAAMAAAEQGPELVEQRGLDWRASDIPAVMNNPLEIALGRCWPWTDAEVATELRGQWLAAIGEAAQSEGVTLAVVPLRMLAEEGGVLDTLVSNGFSVKGPAWRE